jgi:hypothetical protein
MEKLMLEHKNKRLCGTQMKVQPLQSEGRPDEFAPSSELTGIPPTNQDCGTEKHEILPYAFFFQYARKSPDPSWQRVLRSCEALLLAAVLLSRQNQKRKSLPKETLLELLSFLDGRSLCRASATCRSWRDLCEGDEIWEALCRKQFFISFTTFQCKRSGFVEVDDGGTNINISMDTAKATTKSTWRPKDLYKLADLNLKSMLRGTNAQSRFSGFSSTNQRISVPIVVR